MAIALSRIKKYMCKWSHESASNFLQHVMKERNKINNSNKQMYTYPVLSRRSDGRCGGVDDDASIWCAYLLILFQITASIKVSHIFVP